MKGIILRIIKQMGNDKRTLALILIAPVIILMLMYLLLGKNDYRPSISVAESFQMTRSCCSKARQRTRCFPWKGQR